MARYCFISRAQPGHLDFGGMSFIRTAVELKERGHEVQWILSINQTKDNSRLIARTKNIVQNYGIHSQEFSMLHMTASLKSDELFLCAKNFWRYLETGRYDCVVVDRLCVVAGLSAHMAGLPWATIGTDGREWARKRLRSRVNLGVFPGSWDASPIKPTVRSSCYNDFPNSIANTFWATSPFLNISFFPKAYYQDTITYELPKHSHFVGCGEVPEPHAENKYLLVTFGNTFNPFLKNKLVKIMRPLISEFSINVLFLTGNAAMANAIHQAFRHNSDVDVREWMPYDKAYRGAMAVLGHGGTSFIWYGLREGKPLLAIPFMADQFFGAFQLERLNAGRAVVPFMVPWQSRLFRKIIRYIPRKASVYISEREIRYKLRELLTDPKISANSARLSRLMRAGGGVQASASLLERLVQFQEPVTACHTPSCCC